MTGRQRHQAFNRDSFLGVVRYRVNHFDRGGQHDFRVENLVHQPGLRSFHHQGVPDLQFFDAPKRASVRNPVRRQRKVPHLTRPLRVGVVPGIARVQHRRSGTFHDWHHHLVPTRHVQSRESLPGPRHGQSGRRIGALHVGGLRRGRGGVGGEGLDRHRGRTLDLPRRDENLPHHEQCQNHADAQHGLPHPGHHRHRETAAFPSSLRSALGRPGRRIRPALGRPGRASRVEALCRARGCVSCGGGPGRRTGASGLTRGHHASICALTCQFASHPARRERLRLGVLGVHRASLSLAFRVCQTGVSMPRAPVLGRLFDKRNFTNFRVTWLIRYDKSVFRE